MYGIQLVMILVLLGGLIAYLGDKIGMRVGRKRLSLFGLRPRHSSIVVTVVTGTLIAAFSLLTLAAASNDVRTALFRMKEIQAALSQTSEALVASEDELEALKERLGRQRAEVADIVAEKDTAVAQRDAARTERERLAEEISTVKGTLSQARKDLEHWKSRVATLKDLGQTMEDSITKMQTTEAKLRRDISVLSEQYLILEGRLRSGAFTHLKDEIVSAAVLAGGRDREAIEKDLLALLEKADGEALERGARIEGKEGAIELAKEEFFFQAVDVLSSQAGEWVARVVATQNTVQGEPLFVYFHLFPRTLIYKQGEVIGERVMNGGRRDQEAQILGLLDEVNRDALEKGMITSPTGDVGRLTGEEFVEALLALRRVGGEATVSVVAAEDVWNTEGPLKVELSVTPL